MRKFTCSLIIVLVLLIPSCLQAASGTDPNGVLGLKWGDSPQVVKSKLESQNIKFMQKSPSEKQNSYASGELYVYEGHVLGVKSQNTIKVKFLKNALYEVNFYFNSSNEFPQKKLKEALFDIQNAIYGKYGEPIEIWNLHLGDSKDLEKRDTLHRQYLLSEEDYLSERNTTQSDPKLFNELSKYFNGVYEKRKRWLIGNTGIMFGNDTQVGGQEISEILLISGLQLRYYSNKGLEERKKALLSFQEQQRMQNDQK
ncbi:hypothetical protein LJC31_08230, partial [Synergistaceae bacterium OttesenSCG-928-I11]|nr:hypothetical protein [Synergistaceae bacterium OttesenSCG-928-I11]